MIFRVALLKILYSDGREMKTLCYVALCCVALEKKRMCRVEKEKVQLKGDKYAAFCCFAVLEEKKLSCWKRAWKEEACPKEESFVPGKKE